MAKVEERLLTLLRDQPDHQIGLVELSKQLARDGVLGFGVQASDIVYALKKESKVEYDPERDVVMLAAK